MITIFYPSNCTEITRWKLQLDRTSLKYEFIMQDSSSLAHLVDGEKQVDGQVAIESYLDGLEKFVKGWYEDRCDKYDFLD